VPPKHSSEQKDGRYETSHFCDSVAPARRERDYINRVKGHRRSEWRTKSLRWFTQGKPGNALKRALRANRGSPSRSSASFLFLCSLFQTSRGARNPRLEWLKPLNALAFLSVYAARANGYFNDEGVTLELIIVRGGVI
jgi:hypothetical protein